ncbi:alpha/beta hydrolase [Christiangramia sp. ASW11-125]|uniref:alpha/beta hydrolase n=1 Tax=Christiangramia sp. ASW11-125 TaxID=3400701 RepID=UPI003AADE6E8
MKIYLIFFIALLTFSFSNSQSLVEEVSVNDLNIGKRIEIKSNILKENRVLNIYLPQSYETDSSKAYPVIYLLDGSKNEDFIHITGIVQFGSFSWINMIPESIVVGIANTDRKKDFTYPSNNKLDQDEFPTSGESEKFIKFLKQEALPFINEKYRTTQTKTLIGQSLGGLVGTEILLKTPHIFDNYIIVSPSLWWDDESLLEEEIADFDSSKQIYIAVGKEGEVMERTAKKLYKKLDDLKMLESKVYFDFLEDKSHGDALHQAVYNAFELFSNKTGNNNG